MTTLAKNEDESIADFEVVTKFLAEKTVSECPACGTKNWDVFGYDRSPESYFPVLFSMNHEGVRKYTRLIIAECGNCGFVRHHSYRAFERWKAERDNKETKAMEDGDAPKGAI